MHQLRTNKALNMSAYVLNKKKGKNSKKHIIYAQCFISQFSKGETNNIPPLTNIIPP